MADFQMIHAQNILSIRGFSSPHDVSRVFRARVGLTPTEYAREPYRRPN